jgi:predicted NAD-dependent protein-ADP-ribosyltransferase YbiA (DUF1768 family)
MQFREYIIGEPVLQFWSNAERKHEFYKFSNFQHIKDGIQPFDDKFIFASTEHAFQSRKYVEKDRARFSIDGDLGNIDGFSLVFKEKEYEKKRDYWMNKDNIGVIAKMATDKTRGKKLGLERNQDFVSTDELWMQILLSKYMKEEFKQLLKKTEDIYLLEFDRMAYHRFGVSLAFWGGNIIDNKLWGKNQMGKYLMEIRKQI